MRNNLADGINFCQGTSDTLLEDCSFRGNGDDGITIRNVSKDNLVNLQEKESCDKHLRHSFLLLMCLPKPTERCSSLGWEMILYVAR